MNEDYRPQNGEAWIPFLIRKGEFAEAMILAWQSVEDMVDQMVLQEFDLIYSPKKMDPRVDLVRDVRSFPKKLSFLADMGRLSSIDREVLREFGEERNDLFHGYVYKSTHPVVISGAEKTRLLGLAGKAAQITSNRAWGLWTDQGTNDMGNVGTPHPPRPAGADFADKERNRRIIHEYELEKDREGAES